MDDAAALGADAIASTGCGDCGSEMALAVEGDRLLQRDGIVHFAVPRARWWEDIGYT